MSPLHLGEFFNLLLTKPLVSKKPSVTFVTDEDELRRETQNFVREDFRTSTSNTKLNFVEHGEHILNMNGKAAIVEPDDALFEGRVRELVLRKLLNECNVHTLLRLTTGLS